MTLTSHQRPHRGGTDEWLTPPEIVKAVGPFVLDPCAAKDQPWRTARRHLTVADDGLSATWPKKGLIWCNPPFGPEAGKWLDRMADHNNGIALVPARTETRWFVRAVWERATGILFLAGRPHFHYPNGDRALANCGVPICLVAYGHGAVMRLLESGLPGAFVEGWSV